MEALPRSCEIRNLIVDLFCAWSDFDWSPQYCRIMETTVITYAECLLLENEQVFLLSQRFLLILMNKQSEANEDLEKYFFILVLAKYPGAVELIRELKNQILMLFDNEFAVGLALIVLAHYFLVSRDFSAFGDFWSKALELISDSENTGARDAMISLGVLFARGNLDENLCCSLFQHLKSILKRKDDFENEGRLFYDAAVASFVKLSRCQCFDRQEVGEILFMSLPLSAASPDCHFITDFLANCCEEMLDFFVERFGCQAVSRLLEYHLGTGFISEEVSFRFTALIERLKSLTAVES
jgi:hypothetical protein